MSSRPAGRAPASSAACPNAITSSSVIQSRIAAISWRIVRPNEPTMFASHLLAPGGNTLNTLFDPSLCCPPGAMGCGARSSEGDASMRYQRSRCEPVDPLQRHRTISVAPASPPKRSNSSTQILSRWDSPRRNAALAHRPEFAGQLRLTIRLLCRPLPYPPRARSKSTIFHCLWLYALAPAIRWNRHGRSGWPRDQGANSQSH